ncbi:MAG: fumarylacetoacetate hydrolase family protein [Verrucomicrobia bacterium]|nr:fumarylacetoacetate hydrolase family protein [Verrucomicrobiota bacterium]
MKIQRYLDKKDEVGFSCLLPDGSSEKLAGGLESGFFRTGEAADVAKVLAPVIPPAVYCTGLNYRKHAEETGARIPQFPVLFMKAASAVQNPGDPILIPTRLASHEVDYECELAVVIGKRAKNVSKAEAMDYVAGFTCANDVSARDWQVRFGGSQWCRGKTFDTFLPLGPCLVTPDEIPDPNSLAIRTILNGATMQEESTADMIFDVPSLIEFFSGSTTLLPGTVILTGTPSGVGMARKPPVWLKPGDSVTIEIEKIGRLTNPVALEP